MRFALRMALAFAFAAPFCNLAASPVALTVLATGFLADAAFLTGAAFLSLPLASFAFAFLSPAGFFAAVAGFFTAGLALVAAGFFAASLAGAAFFAAPDADALASAGRFSAFFSAGLAVPDVLAAGFFFSSFFSVDPLAKMK